MTGLLKREGESHDAVLFDSLAHDYEDWAQPISARWPGMFPRRSNARHMIAVDEYRERGVTVVRAELPGIDPAKDVEVSVIKGMLRIKAERPDVPASDEKTYVRKELRSGSFVRVLPMPSGVEQSDISATYADGILEIRICA